MSISFPLSMSLLSLSRFQASRCSSYHSYILHLLLNPSHHKTLKIYICFKYILHKYNSTLECNQDQPQYNQPTNQLLTTPRKKPFQNIVRKGENAGNQHFLLFPQYPIRLKNHHFSCIYFVKSKCFQFGHVQNFVVL